MKRKKTTALPEKNTNCWDFLIHVCDKVYNLLKFGHVFGAMILVLLICILIVIIRYPHEQLPILTNGILSFLGKEKYYFIPLSSLLAISLSGNYYQFKTYSKEIKRICKCRKELIHGLENGKLTVVENHHSSVLKEKNNASN
ncbi:MAG: hypothetical protein WC389_20730 [Lutibacter sp.]|jgi:hypothetical protein